jgi:glycosyltransferase involved in cell wall biosynthesis
MIEAMACGTPVLAFRCGSVPEVIDNGISGIIVDTLTEAVESVEWVLKLDRRRVRATFDERFTSERMAKDYLAIYRSIAEADKRPASLRRASAAQLGLHIVG